MILLWSIFAIAVTSSIGAFGRAVKPRMSQPAADFVNAVFNIALAFVLIWAIARGW